MKLRSPVNLGRTGGAAFSVAVARRVDLVAESDNPYYSASGGVRAGFAPSAMRWHEPNSGVSWR
jgi:hypothetical protein